MEETKASIVRLAELLVKERIPTKKICSRLSKMIPFSGRFTRMLISEEYHRGYESEVTSDLPKGEAFKIPTKGIDQVKGGFGSNLEPVPKDIQMKSLAWRSEHLSDAVFSRNAICPRS